MNDVRNHDEHTGQPSLPWGHAPTRVRDRARAKVELALLALLYVGYSVGRLRGPRGAGQGQAHARDLLHLEALLHLDVERHANEVLDSVPLLALAGSYWYALLHYIVTPAVLLWAYRGPAAGTTAACATPWSSASAIGLVGFTLIPMAPPRMLPGYGDTLAMTAQHGWWGGDASAPRGLGAMTNQLAAMPSLHVGWALWCAWVVFTLDPAALDAHRAPSPTRSAPRWSSSARPTATSSTRSPACW